MIKNKIIENLESALKKIGIEEKNINLEHPVNSNFGDYATAISLKLAKTLKKNPMEIAKKIVKNLPQDETVEKIEIVKPGFINFWISIKCLINYLTEIADGKIEYPCYHLGPSKKIMVEFAHPNTHKLFHIGHLRNISIGESLVRIFEAVGNKVIRTNYQGDVGLHIAKCLYKVKNQKSKLKNLKTLKEKIEFLGQTYTQGQQAYETNKKAKEEILEINRKIYKKDPEIMDLWKETRQWSLDYFEEIYKRVYTHFDRCYFESEMSERGTELVKTAQEKGILELSQKAVVFSGKKYDLDTRVFINALGFPTYEGKELALAEKEFSDFGNIDKCIHVVTPEQKSFFKVTFKVEELLDEKKYKDKQYHLAYEWVKLKHGKMASRLGNIIEGGWLLDETRKKILERFKCDDATAEIIAVAAVKYSFLKNSINNVIAFDFDESITLEGSSAPYIIYTYVRTQSILKKEKTSSQKPNFNHNRNQSCKVEKEEVELLRTIYLFTEAVVKSAKNFAPNFIANYLYELAQKYNLFYQKHPVLKAEKKSREWRILLTKATGEIIKNGLYLLGIKTVEKM